jgi:hypothetical protein
MITNNFKKILMLIFSSTATGTDTPKITTSNLPKLTGLDGLEKQITNRNGYEQRLNGWYNMMNHIAKTNSNSNLYIRVGTGTAAPTENDYELTMPNTDVSCDTVVVGNSANYTKTYTATFSNPTNSDITVTEVGLYGNLIFDAYGENYMDVLLDRTVLTTPITIPAGESKAITYELGF